MTLLTRRGLLAGAAGLAAPKKRRRPVGMQPDQQGVFFQLVIQGGGTFTYDAAGNLRSAEVGQTITDPIQGITCYAGISTFNGHGAVISLFSSTLDAQLWYADTGSSSQGALIASIASASGTDPFGNAFKGGITNYVHNNEFIEIGGGTLALGSLNPSTVTTGNAGLNFADALAAGTAPALSIGAPSTSSLQQGTLTLYGESQDASKPAQAVITPNGAAPTTTALVEVQGDIQATGLHNIIAGGNFFAQLGNVVIQNAGHGLQVKEGSNAKQGRATLVAGSVVVADTSITASSIIVPGYVTPSANAGPVFVSSVTVGTGFTLKSTNAADTSVVGYEIFEPA